MSSIDQVVHVQLKVCMSLLFCRLCFLASFLEDSFGAFLVTRLEGKWCVDSVESINSL